MSSVTAASAQSERIAIGRLWRIGLLTIILSIVANLIVYAIATAVFAVQYELLGPASIVFSTVGYLIIATIVFVIVGRRARHPVQTYRAISVIALLLSFAMPLAAGAGLIPVGGPASPQTVVTMIVMHVVAGVITVYLLTTQAVEK